MKIKDRLHLLIAGFFTSFFPRFVMVSANLQDGTEGSLKIMNKSVQ